MNIGKIPQNELNIPNLRDLPKSFEGKGQVRGYSFHQISASPNGYLYAVKTKEVVTHYEVFKRVENAYYGVISYPTDKAFGKWAWTTSNLERANEILESFNSPENGRR